MKKSLFFFLLLSVISISCEKEKEQPGPKGLVSFSQGPEYGFGAIRFAASVQFGGDGKAVSCDYRITDGSSVVSEGNVECGSNTDGMNLFWESELEVVNIDAQTFSGKTLEVLLDPSHEITLPEYTSQQYIDLYKKASVVIP